MRDERVMQHEAFDTYTRQALAWRQGDMHIKNGDMLTWLELAIYDDKYYVSFPPVPSVFMLPWTFIFGLETPNSFINWIYAYTAFIFAYLIFKRRCNKRTW